MRLNAGTQAIGFSVSDYKNKPVQLTAYSGSKVLLSFFRDAYCPFCNLRVHQLINHFDEFDKHNLKVITFFAATQEDIYENAGQQNAPFPIISDPQLTWYRKYAVESSSMGLIRAMLKPAAMMKIMTSRFFNLKSVTKKPLIPADFLIDEDQIVARAHYGRDYGDHISIPEILSWAKTGN